MQACDKTGERRAFSSPIVSTLINFKWQVFGRRLFRIQFVVFLLNTAINTAFSWLFIQNLADGQLPMEGTREANWLLGLWLPFLGFALYLLFLEVMQASHQPLWTTMRNPWNWMQFYSIACRLALAGLFWDRSFPLTTINLLGQQLTLAYFRIIYTLRGFALFGPLIRMIQQIL